MSIQLPMAADVTAALIGWQAEDGRLTLLLKRYGEPAPALRHYGLILWQEAKVQRASQALTGSLALKPEDARTWTDLAGVFGAAGQQTEAASCLEEALTHDPTPAVTWLSLGAIRNAQGRADDAIAAYTAALARDRSLVQAWLGVGLLQLRAKHYAEAIDALREAAARSDGDATIRACFGEALFGAGQFADASASFGAASDLQPDNQAFRFKRAQTRFVADVVEHGVDDAFAALEGDRLTEGERDRIVRDGFHLLSGFGHRDAAIRLGERRLAAAPGDATQIYLLAALKREPMARAPDDYIRSYFDQFADDFDHKLIDVLAYSAPHDLAALVKQHDRPLRRVLDLGCGTGLAGSHLAAAGRTLTGVDLSSRMLAKARERGCYARLVESEILAFLATEAADAYDLAVTADVLVYFGDLTLVFDEVARVLVDEGLWALSIETTDLADACLLPSGRFAHRVAYVEMLAKSARMEILGFVDTIIRLEANHPAVGALVLLRKIHQTSAGRP